MTMWYRGQPVQGPLLASSVPLPRDEEFAKMLASDYDEQDDGADPINAAGSP